ncbi:lipoprotein-releasing ABC transporter permease subunit LolC [Candidatus Palibaumannia cicadellinicola]|uniref:Lipoprotein releasing system transmembrane protein LolC n=1 Tax=Candidatus Palibaumannia cicadellinicola TaxID=186490 RepID=A0A088N224_9GAMM|nr:lipoprotein-releasing ABC transporter permease subunit LolC [Candidatus Baumannia cicadellinicola]AIN47346.1 Lipoprotein releasing system transmembrane protein LolC [Candidatus Baumannia cicadellinicola]
MYQPIALYISLRYMRGLVSNHFGSLISWLSTIGITLGVMALVTVLSVMNGFKIELESNILGFIPQALLTTHEGFLDPTVISVLKPNILQGTTRVASLTIGDVVLQSAKGLAMGVMLGVNSSDPEPLANYLVDTHINQLAPGQYQVILGEKLADKLSVKLSDQLRLIVPSVNQFTPMGRIPSQRLFTVAGTYATKSEVDDYQLLVNQQDASRLMHYPSGYVTGLRLWLQQPLSVDRLSQQHLPDGLVWKDWRERKSELFQAVRMEKNIMVLLLSLIVAVAGFNILTSLCLLVMEKQSEVAILKTQGLNSSQVMLVFMALGTIIGIIGVLFGTFIGVLLVSLLNKLVLFDSAVLPVNIEPLQITIIAVLTIVVAWLSTLYPSWYAATINSVETLRYE